jgi:putative integral membrane protein (TIGR02587 family)
LGVPLLYTMEVWWIGSSVSPPRMLFALLATLFVVYMLSRTEGFRKAKPTGELQAVGDAIEAVAIGLVCSASTLIFLQQIAFDNRITETLGKIIFESVPFSLGVALANQFLSNPAKTESSAESSDGDKETDSDQVDLSSPVTDGSLNATLADLGATLVGAIIIALSIAPTDEVDMLVADVSGPWLIVMMIASLVLSYGIVFQANFTSQGQRRLQTGLFQSPLGETIFSYLVSLLASALMLGFFRQIDLSTPWDLALNSVIVLGLPATIGGAAGRLAL